MLRPPHQLLLLSSLGEPSWQRDQGSSQGSPCTCKLKNQREAQSPNPGLCPEQLSSALFGELTQTSAHWHFESSTMANEGRVTPGQIRRAFFQREEHKYFLECESPRNGSTLLGDRLLCTGPGKQGSGLSASWVWLLPDHHRAEWETGQSITAYWMHPSPPNPHPTEISSPLKSRDPVNNSVTLF